MNTPATNDFTQHILTAAGDYYSAIQFDRYNASKAIRYWQAVSQLLNNGDPQPLANLRRVTVTDIHKTRYALMTDPNAIRRWWSSLFQEKPRRLPEKFEGDPPAMYHG